MNDKRLLEQKYKEMKLTYKNLVNANVDLVDENKMLKEEIERLNNIINEINSIVEYWGYDKEHNDISSFRMAMKSIKDVLGSDKE